LVLAVGLIPENELTRQLDIEIDPKTNGPIVDENFMTSMAGVFAAGNVVTVFDLVDYVSLTGEMAGRGAAKYIQGNLELEQDYTEVTPGENVSFVVPQRIRKDNLESKLPLYFRVRQKQENVKVIAKVAETICYQKKHRVVLPPEMLVEELDSQSVKDTNQNIVVNVMGGTL